MILNNIIYTALSICLFFIAGISILSLQDNDIKIPQEKVSIKLDVSHKFNLNVASSKNEENQLLVNN